MGKNQEGIGWGCLFDICKKKLVGYFSLVGRKRSSSGRCDNTTISTPVTVMHNVHADVLFYLFGLMVWICFYLVVITWLIKTWLLSTLLIVNLTLLYIASNRNM